MFEQRVPKNANYLSSNPVPESEVMQNISYFSSEYFKSICKKVLKFVYTSVYSFVLFI